MSMLLPLSIFISVVAFCFSILLILFVSADPPQKLRELFDELFSEISVRELVNLELNIDEVMVMLFGLMIPYVNIFIILGLITWFYNRRF